MAQCMRFGRITGGPAGQHAVGSCVILFSSLCFLELFDIFISQRVVAGALTLAVRLNTFGRTIKYKIKQGFFER